MKTTTQLLFPAILLFTSCKSNDKAISIDYFGLEIPIEKADIFAPGIISLENRWEGNANFSVDGQEFYFNVFTDSMRDKAVYQSKYANGKWNLPAKLEILGSYGNWEPFISYSGKELFFVSSRPPGNELWNGRIWKSIRDEENNWMSPEIVDIGYPTDNGFWFPNHSRSNSNVLYFGGNIEEIGSVGKGDLHTYFIEQDSVVNIRTLNSEYEDWDPFISPDESYLMWASDREGGYGGTDIYVSFKVEGKWGEPKNLGSKVNSSKYEVAPRISSDGRVLFFDRPVDGTQDIFWISSSVIEELRQ